MLVTLSDQLYIMLTCGITGFFVLSRLYGRTDKDNVPGVGSCIVCGLAVLTAYAGYYSLFSGVGLTANIILIIACIIFACIDRKAYPGLISSVFKPSHKKNHGKGVHPVKHGKLLSVIRYAFIVLIVLISAYFASAGKFAYDTGTYHAQSIHWIESYGVVRGLAYMQTRLGFNSSYFCLCALYSMHFMGRSLHALSGFLASFVMVYSFNGLWDHIIPAVCIREKGERCFRLRVSDFLYIAPFFYFVITAIELISPATDFGVIWMILWLCIRWTELIEEETEEKRENAAAGYALLCVMAVFLVSIKLSVGVLALLVIKPAYELIRSKQWKDIGKYIAAGVILILPYFIRNYLITGWLVYPFPALDLFDPDWKIPLDGVRYEADEVVVWARYTKDTALIDQGIREWFPVWWSEQGAANRYLSISAFAGAALFVLRTVVSSVHLCCTRLKSIKQNGSGDTISDTVVWGRYIYFGIILFACFTFFMISAPSNRFGYAYILLLPLYASGDCVVNVIPGIFNGVKDQDKGSSKFNIKGIAPIVFGVVVFFLICAPLLKGVYMFGSDDRHYAAETAPDGCLILPGDYPEADSASKQWEGIEIYYPVTEGEQIWYHCFPAILYEGNLESLERRGPRIRDGFKLK